MPGTGRTRALSARRDAKLRRPDRLDTVDRAWMLARMGKSIAGRIKKSLSKGAAAELTVERRRDVSRWEFM